MFAGVRLKSEERDRFFNISTVGGQEWSEIRTDHICVLGERVACRHGRVVEKVAD
jgi:hypothetical protein